MHRELHITLTEDGMLTVTGNVLGDTFSCYAMLEAARDVVHEHRNTAKQGYLNRSPNGDVEISPPTAELRLAGN